LLRRDGGFEPGVLNFGFGTRFKSLNKVLGEDVLPEFTP
jgi:hypothetical protein